MNTLEPFGFDDVRIDAQGNYWIVEYKGGRGHLDPGTATRPPQMDPLWVAQRIRWLREDGNPMGNILDAAQRAGKLRGVAIHTEYQNGVVGQTTVIRRWSY